MVKDRLDEMTEAGGSRRRKGISAESDSRRIRQTCVTCVSELGCLLAFKVAMCLGKGLETILSKR
jgi:hypothetical protein